ncbi:MAG: hypothetical protein V4492_07025 [Chlamydiota bacterium]
MEKRLYRLWIVLLAVTGGIACWFSATAAREAWGYFSLNGTAVATISDVEIRELSSSRYALKASYQYSIGGVQHTVESVLKYPQFLNRFTAENELASWRGKQCKVYYKKTSPQFSRLEKEFPRKPCLHALLTLGVLAYFYSLRGLFSRLLTRDT